MLFFLPSALRVVVCHGNCSCSTDLCGVQVCFSLLGVWFYSRCEDKELQPEGEICSPKDFRAGFGSVPLYKQMFVPVLSSENTWHTTSPWDVTFTLLSCCSPLLFSCVPCISPMSSSTASTGSIKSMHAALCASPHVKGNTINTEAIKTTVHFLISTEAGGAPLLLLAQNADRSSSLLLKHCFQLIHSQVSRGCGLPDICCVLGEKRLPGSLTGTGLQWRWNSIL